MKRFLYLGLAVAALFVIWTIGWFWAANEVRKTVDVLATADGVTSPRLTCGTLGVSGWPFRFDLNCDAATVVSGDVTVTAPRLAATALVYRPTHVLLFLDGPATIADAFTGSESEVSWELMEASIRLDGWRLARLSVEGKTIAWTNALTSGPPLFSASDAQFHLIDIPEQHRPEAGLAGLALYAAATDAATPGFGINDAALEIEAELSNVPDDVRRLSDPELLRNWQAAGGVLKLVRLHGTEGEDTAEGSGTININPNGRLNGELTLASRGIAERMAPLLPNGTGPLLFGKAAEDGSHSQTLHFRDGVLFVGLIPLLTVEPLFTP